MEETKKKTPEEEAEQASKEDAQEEKAEELPENEAPSEPVESNEIEELRAENIRLKTQLEAMKIGFSAEYIEDAVTLTFRHKEEFHDCS